MKCNWKNHVFYEVWEEANGCSMLSGRPISEPDPRNFAHIIPKGKYPQATYDKRNIYVVTYYEHFLLDHGTHDMRDKYAEMIRQHGVTVDWSKLYHLADKLRKEYTR